MQLAAPLGFRIARGAFHHHDGTRGELGGQRPHELAHLLVRHGVGRVNEHQVPRARCGLHVAQRLRLLHASHRTGSFAAHRLLHRLDVATNHRNRLRVGVQQGHGGRPARERLASQRTRATKSIQYAGVAQQVVALQLGEEGFFHPVRGGACVVPRHRGQAHASGGTGNNAAHRVSPLK